MANQFYFSEEQMRIIITALIFTSGGCMIDDDNTDILNRCAKLAIKLGNQYGRPLELDKMFSFDEPVENEYSEEILKAFPELKE
ncbi:MAG: hypothetical protein M0R32_09870 [Candidatus Cloacimonetes bacterium]|jgi:hypothetical protein|nr:hypothetical protein [Candidatus Cloacimonadota bacterium]